MDYVSIVRKSAYFVMLVDIRLGVQLISWLRSRVKQGSVLKIADEIDKKIRNDVSISVVDVWL